MCVCKSVSLCVCVCVSVCLCVSMCRCVAVSVSLCLWCLSTHTHTRRHTDTHTHTHCVSVCLCVCVCNKLHAGLRLLSQQAMRSAHKGEKDQGANDEKQHEQIPCLGQAPMQQRRLSFRLLPESLEPATPQASVQRADQKINLRTDREDAYVFVAILYSKQIQNLQALPNLHPGQITI